MTSTDEAMTDAQALAAVLAEDATARAGDHPQLYELADYLAEALAPETEARVRDHLVACRACASKLLDLEPLSEPGPETAEGVADLAVAAGWREHKSRIAALEAARSRRRTARWMSAVAAVFCVATLVLSDRLTQQGEALARQEQTIARQEQTIARLDVPEVNPNVAYLDAFTTRGGENAATTVELGPEDRTVLLILTPPSGSGPWEVEVRSAAGAEVWSGGGFELTDEGTLRLGMPRALMPAGEYEVLLYDVDGGGREQLGAFPLYVREP